MGVTKDTLLYGTDVELTASANKSFTDYRVNGRVVNNRFTTPRMSAMAKDVYFDFSTNRDTTTAFASAGDLQLTLGAGGNVDRIAREVNKFANELGKQVSQYHIDQDKLKGLLPSMNLYLNAGRDNPLYNIARLKGYSFSSVYLNMQTNPHEGMLGDMRVGAMHVGLSCLIQSILIFSRTLQVYNFEAW